MTHYATAACECRSCIAIRQHKAIQAYGAAGKEPVLEPSHFAPRDDDEAQAEYLRKWGAKQEARQRAKAQATSHLNWKTAGAVLVACIAAWQVMQWVGALAYWVGGKLP